MSLLNKHSGKLLFVLNGTIAHLLFSKSPSLNDKNWFAIAILPIVLLFSIIFSESFKRQFSQSKSDILITVILLLTFLIESFFMFPNNYLQSILIGIPFYIFSILRIYFALNNLENNKSVLINLVPLLFFYQHYWSPTTPFSLWVVFTFLVLLDLYKTIFEKDLKLAPRLSNSEKLTTLFMIVLLIQSWFLT